MKPTEFTILILLFSGIWLQAQDRQKELDSLIHYAASLPEDTLKAKVLSKRGGQWLLTIRELLL